MDFKMRAMRYDLITILTLSVSFVFYMQVSNAQPRPMHRISRGVEISQIGVQEFGGSHGDERAAFERCRRAAEEGDKIAQRQLGDFYLTGREVQADSQKAFKWYEKSALQGYPDAQCILGDCYRLGLGVKRNASKALKWYKESARRGNAGSRRPYDDGPADRIWDSESHTLGCGHIVSGPVGLGPGKAGPLDGTHLPLRRASPELSAAAGYGSFPGQTGLCSGGYQRQPAAALCHSPGRRAERRRQPMVPPAIGCAGGGGYECGMRHFPFAHFTIRSDLHQ